MSSYPYNTYPAQLPNLPNLATLDQVGTSCADIDLNGTRMREWMAAVGEYILAIATTVGVTNSSDVNSIQYKIAHAITTDIPSARIYSGGAWTNNLPFRAKIFIKQPGDPEPTAPTKGTNDIVFRKTVE